MSSRNKWLYTDHLEEVLGKPEEAEIVRAMSLAKWDPLEAQAMEIMAAHRATESRARAAERTRRWRLKRAEELRLKQAEKLRHAKATRPTGDPFFDAVRLRVYGQP